MVRLGAAFIAVCMVLIAGSLGAVLYLSAGLSGLEAAVAAIGLLIGLMVYNAASTRGRDRAQVSDQIADLSRGTADLARQVGEIGRRMEVLESATASAAAHAAERARAATAPLTGEIEVLGHLVKELAESVAAHEAVLTQAAAPASAGGSARASEHAAAVPDSAAASDASELGEPEPERAASRRFRGFDRNQVIAVIAGAIEHNRLDLHLQPIVTLPQRKVRFYEALTRLRADDGEMILPADFLMYAESGGLMPRIDNMVLFRCVQVARRLAAKNREIGLFCNVSGSTLNDAEFFPQLSDFMQANRALAPSLVLEFSQGALRHMGPLEHESLAALADLGFRFSLDRLSDLRVEPRELADRGFRFVKASATLLLNRAGSSAMDIHPADFSDLLGRFGIDLIADRIESEGMVVDLLDYDVRFGQGFLFSPPRPVRGEVLGPERAEPLRREPAATRPSEEGAPPVQPAELAVPEPRTAPERRAGMLAQLARGVVRRA
jgi:cyclic-di-GMP phosphodiesterase TipF (flagellum assembly factor)